MATLLETNLRTMSVGILYLLAEKAITDYPGSTRAAPSVKVVVSLTAQGELRSGDKAHFPYSVPWDIWQQAVMPVIEDLALQIRTSEGNLRNYLNMHALKSRADSEVFISRIRDMLEASLRSAGFLADTSITPTSTLAAGEPVVRRGTVGDEDFEPADLEVLLHPEGHARLVYAEVDGGPKE